MSQCVVAKRVAFGYAMRVDTGVITSYHINIPFGTLGVVHDADPVLGYGGTAHGYKAVFGLFPGHFGTTGEALKVGAGYFLAKVTPGIVQLTDPLVGTGCHHCATGGDELGAGGLDDGCEICGARLDDYQQLGGGAPGFGNHGLLVGR